MLIRLTTDRVLGLGTLQRSGEVIDLPAAEARALLQCQAAEIVETAAIEAPETASKFQKSKRTK